MPSDTQRGQILVSRTGDDTLRVLCCVLCVCVLCLCFCVCCWCAMCGCWRVCWCVCCCWCVTLTPPLPLRPPSSPSPHTHTPLLVCTFKRPLLFFKTSLMCSGTSPASVTTCARGAGTHGDVLNVHTGVFSVPHHTARTHHGHNEIHTRHNNHHHNNTQGDRERRQRKRTREEKTRQDKRRRDKTRRQEKMKVEIERREERRQEDRRCKRKEETR